MEEAKIKKDIKEIVDALVKKAEEKGFDDFWFYSTLFDGEEMMKTFFEKYFEKNEGSICSVDKADFVVKGIKKMIEIKQVVKLNLTYGQYKESGGDIGCITDLD